MPESEKTLLSLHERVKELTCLYGIAQRMARADILSDRVIQDIADLIPSAWQYPEIAACRMVVDGKAYVTKGFSDHGPRQSADIRVHGIKCGHIEVMYGAKMPERDEGPFLKEERRLLDTIAKQVAIILERRKAEGDKARLQKQLLHADRLATIGQLAAGVAHELNEPLGIILGFAQLSLKDQHLSGQARGDIEKIVTASLSAREIIQKLLLFARQSPTHKCPVDLNKVASEGLYLFERRCEKEGIELVRSLQPDLPMLAADPGQLTQVLVNLVVNGIQAMPKGGTLTVKTRASSNAVILEVQDTGIGMNEETLDRIFIPFFTTKDVNEGTGLGLPVVHGILVSHNASIAVDSKPGKGTRFTITFPQAKAARAKKGRQHESRV